MSETEFKPAGRLWGYDRAFWLAYLSNGLTTLANGMMVRYADFVSSIGGDEQQLGLIVGAGMIGSILLRLWLGEAIDRHGAGRVWFASLMLYTGSLFLHLQLTTAYGANVFLVRCLMQACLAGIFGSSITFVSVRVPPRRMAEVIGVLGTSGFLGLMVGPLISDVLASLSGTASDAATRLYVARMFQTAGTLSLMSVVVTWLATRDDVRPERHERPSLWKVVAKYHPLMILITASVMGAGFAIPSTFLRPFASETGLGGVGLFFAVYSVTGFTARMASRSLFERFGNRPWIVVGLILLTISFLCYPPVTQTWHMVVPAMIAGCAHALLFPSIVSAGTAVFPRKYLGVATSLVLAMFDVGGLVSTPIAGTFIRFAKPHTPHAYPWMFFGTAVIFGMVTVMFCLSSSGTDRYRGDETQSG